MGRSVVVIRREGLAFLPGATRRPAKRVPRPGDAPEQLVPDPALDRRLKRLARLVGARRMTLGQARRLVATKLRLWRVA